MLTRLRIAHFKRFGEVDLELGQNVLFVGPNNSGKTTALQALALWETAVRAWAARRLGRDAPKRKTGVALHRRDLLAVPVPEARQLWNQRRVRDVSRASGSPRKEPLRIRIGVEGLTRGEPWACGIEFDLAGPDLVYCRPHPPWNGGEGRVVPEAALVTQLAYLPPMSGLVANEPRLDPGAVQVRLGEGRTAEVLRNLCYGLTERPEAWARLVEVIRGVFGVELLPPDYVAARGEIAMDYVEDGVKLDLSAAGRGLQQVVLLVAHMLRNPGATLLLDEPDAHLEVLRQRQVYDVLTTVARDTGSQILAASHSEVLLNEAAGRDVVVAFVGRPHRIDDRGSQVAKALREIGFEHYLQAQQTGWVLYLEGSTDLEVLRAFARTLGHPAAHALARPYVHYVGNVRKNAQSHFHGLREAVPELVGLVLLDRDEQDRGADSGGPLALLRWARREIENYLCQPEVLVAYAASLAEERGLPLFQLRYTEAMEAAIRARVPPAALANRADRWWRDTKATDDFLDLVMDEFFKAIGLPNLLRKSDYHVLAALVPAEAVDPEVVAALDRIVAVAEQAVPASPGTPG